VTDKEQTKNIEHSLPPVGARTPSPTIASMVIEDVRIVLLPAIYFHIPLVGLPLGALEICAKHTPYFKAPQLWKHLSESSKTFND